MTPTEKRSLAERARVAHLDALDWRQAHGGVRGPQACAEYILAHDPELLVLLWDLVNAVECETVPIQIRALNAVYAHIGYEP